MNECVGKPAACRMGGARHPDPDCVPAGSGCRRVDAESVDCVVVVGGLDSFAADGAVPEAARVGLVVRRVLK